MARSSFLELATCIRQMSDTQSYSVATHAGVKPNLQTYIKTMRRVGVSKDKVRTRNNIRVLLLLQISWHFAAFLFELQVLIYNLLKLDLAFEPKVRLL